MATANLTVPIILDWKDIEAYMGQHDIVEVIRCKDCVFFDPNDTPAQAMPNVRRCGWLKIAMSGDGYCSYGRRKDG